MQRERFMSRTSRCLHPTIDAIQAARPRTAPVSRRPRTDRLAIVELIRATTPKTGLKAECVLDTRTYEKGIQVSDAEMKELNIAGNDFHPEWNYSISPRSAANS